MAQYLFNDKIYNTSSSSDTLLNQDYLANEDKLFTLDLFPGNTLSEKWTSLLYSLHNYLEDEDWGENRNFHRLKSYLIRRIKLTLECHFCELRELCLQKCLNDEDEVLRLDSQQFVNNCLLKNFNFQERQLSLKEFLEQKKLCSFSKVTDIKNYFVSTDYIVFGKDVLEFRHINYDEWMVINLNLMNKNLKNTVYLSFKKRLTPCPDTGAEWDLVSWDTIPLNFLKDGSISLNIKHLFRDFNTIIRLSPPYNYSVRVNLPLPAWVEGQYNTFFDNSFPIINFNNPHLLADDQHHKRVQKIFEKYGVLESEYKNEFLSCLKNTQLFIKENPNLACLCCYLGNNSRISNVAFVLPLFLNPDFDIESYADLALVVSTCKLDYCTDKKLKLGYHCITVLEMEWARKNCRLLGPIKNKWLMPPPLGGEQKKYQLSSDSKYILNDETILKVMKLMGEDKEQFLSNIKILLNEYYPERLNLSQFPLEYQKRFGKYIPRLEGSSIRVSKLLHWAVDEKALKLEWEQQKNGLPIWYLVPLYYNNNKEILIKNINKKTPSRNLNIEITNDEKNRFISNIRILLEEEQNNILNAVVIPKKYLNRFGEKVPMPKDLKNKRKLINALRWAEDEKVINFEWKEQDNGPPALYVALFGIK